MAGIAPPVDADSQYKPVERVTRRFHPLAIPKALQAALPFASKPKQDVKQKRKSLAAKRAVVAEPEERKAATLMQQLHTMHNVKKRKRKEKANEQRAVRAKKCAHPRPLSRAARSRATTRPRFGASVGMQIPFNSDRASPHLADSHVRTRRVTWPPR